MTPFWELFRNHWIHEDLTEKFYNSHTLENAFVWSGTKNFADFRKCDNLTAHIYQCFVIEGCDTVLGFVPNLELISLV